SVSSLNFQRFSLEISQQIQLKAAGRFSWMLQAGKTWGIAPLFSQHIAVGTGKNGWVSSPNTFETLFPSTFFGEEQISIFKRYRFQAWKTFKKWFNPQLSLHHAIGYGTFANTTLHALPVQA